MIRAAIVGLGRWGQRLVDAVQEAGRPRGAAIRFTHAAVRSPDRVHEYCARQGLTMLPLAEVLALETIDAVVLATPHSQHPGQVLAAAAAGKHVFVEKPLALTKADALAAVAACREAGVVLALGHNRRFLPALAALHAMVQAGELGTLLHGEGVFAGAFGLAYRPGAWRASPQDSPAGGLTAMGIHTLDVLIHCLGPVRSVSGQSLRRVLTIPMDDTTTGMLQFHAGPSGHLATMMATAWTWQLRLFGTRGFAEMPDETVLRRQDRGGGARAYTFPVVDTERLELEAFAAAVAGTAPYPVALEDVVHGIAALEALLTSIAAGSAPVTVR